MDSTVTVFLASCFGIFVTGALAQSAYSGGSPAGYNSAPGGYGGGGGGGGYGGGGGGGGYGGGYANRYPGQGSGIYFKKPIPIDEKPVFFRTPYWLPNMYYGHYGYPWTEWFDGGPRFVVPIMTAYPNGGGGTQSYQTGYGVNGVGPGGYSGGSPAYPGSGTATQTPPDATTVDPLNDGFSYYKGIPFYQTYYEKYLLDKAQVTTPTPASA